MRNRHIIGKHCPPENMKFRVLVLGSQGTTVDEQHHQLQVIIKYSLNGEIPLLLDFPE